MDDDDKYSGPRYDTDSRDQQSKHPRSFLPPSLLCSTALLSLETAPETLEFIHLILIVVQLLENPLELALLGRTLLGAADGLVHAWRSTDEDLEVLSRLGFG